MSYFRTRLDELIAAYEQTTVRRSRYDDIAESSATLRRPAQTPRNDSGAAEPPVYAKNTQTQERPWRYIDSTEEGRRMFGYKESIDGIMQSSVRGEDVWVSQQPLKHGESIEESYNERFYAEDTERIMQSLVRKDGTNEAYDEQLYLTNSAERPAGTYARAAEADMDTDTSRALDPKSRTLDSNLHSDLYMERRADPPAAPDTPDTRTEIIPSDFESRLRRIEERKIDIEELSEEFLMDSRRYSGL